MKPVTCAALAGLLFLAACSSMNRPYIAHDGDCDEIIDTRERLDCYERARQAERDWREEKRREDETADPET